MSREIKFEEAAESEERKNIRKYEITGGRNEIKISRRIEKNEERTVETVEDII